MTDTSYLHEYFMEKSNDVQDEDKTVKDILDDENLNTESSNGNRGSKS